MEFKDTPGGAGGGFFKPADHADAVALLIEVKAFERQRPSAYGPKDSARCDVTVFGTQEALDAGSPTETIQNTRIEKTILTRDLEAIVGAATIVKLGQWTGSKPGAKPAWVWQNPSQDTKSKVVTYAKAREAEIQAAVDAAPDFE